MSLKNQDPDLFGLFNKSPIMIEYLLTLIAGTYRSSPTAVTQTCKNAQVSYPQNTLTEALALNLKSTLVAYFQSTYQEGGTFTGWGFTVNTLDDIVKYLSTSGDYTPEINAAALAILDGTYTKTA